jgi:hypothetical protein
VQKRIVKIGNGKMLRARKEKSEQSSESIHSEAFSTFNSAFEIE